MCNAMQCMERVYSPKTYLIFVPSYLIDLPCNAWKGCASHPHCTPSFTSTPHLSRRQQHPKGQPYLLSKQARKLTSVAKNLCWENVHFHFHLLLLPRLLVAKCVEGTKDTASNWDMISLLVDYTWCLQIVGMHLGIIQFVVPGPFKTCPHKSLLKELCISIFSENWTV